MKYVKCHQIMNFFVLFLVRQVSGCSVRGVEGESGRGILCAPCLCTNSSRMENWILSLKRKGRVWFGSNENTKQFMNLIILQMLKHFIKYPGISKLEKGRCTYL